MREFILFVFGLVSLLFLINSNRELEEYDSRSNHPTNKVRSKYNDY